MSVSLDSHIPVRLSLQERSVEAWGRWLELYGSEGRLLTREAVPVGNEVEVSFKIEDVEFRWIGAKVEAAGSGGEGYRVLRLRWIDPVAAERITEALIRILRKT